MAEKTVYESGSQIAQAGAEKEIIKALARKSEKKNLPIFWRVVAVEKPKLTKIFKGLLSATTCNDYEKYLTLKIKNIAEFSEPEKEWRNISRYEEILITDQGIAMTLFLDSDHLLLKINEKTVELFWPDFGLRSLNKEPPIKIALSATIVF